MKKQEIQELGSDLIKKHPDKKEVLFIAVNDALEYPDNDPKIQEFADWMQGVCDDDVHIEPEQLTKGGQAVLIRFQYRDAANNKDVFDHLIDLEEYPETIELVTDFYADGEAEITMGQYGSPYRNDFFGSTIHPDLYDQEIDHNVLSIEKISYVTHIDEFKKQAENLIDKFQELIELLPQKGDTTETCQRLTLQQALNELSYAVNGTTQNDMYTKIQDEEV